MIATIFLIIVGFIVLLVLWHVLQNIVKLIINSIVGLILLIIVNMLNLFPALGYSNIEITWVGVLVCALAGIPGAVLLMLLHIAGLY